MLGKERVLAIELDGADQVFNPVGDDLDVAICQEGLQPFPVVMDVGELFPQPGFAGLRRCASSHSPKAATSGAVRAWRGSVHGRGVISAPSTV